MLVEGLGTIIKSKHTKENLALDSNVLGGELLPFFWGKQRKYKCTVL